MKSSNVTRSPGQSGKKHNSIGPAELPGASVLDPDDMSALAIRSPLGNEMPTNETSWSAGGTEKKPKSWPTGPKSWTQLDWSTSENIAPKLLTVAGVFVPGMKKRISISVVPRGVNNRSGENATNAAG